MKRAVVTLQIGEVHWHRNARQSVEDACSRWNADLIVLSEWGRGHPWWEKCRVPSLCSSWDEVLYTDLDVVWRGDAPWPTWDGDLAAVTNRPKLDPMFAETLRRLTGLRQRANGPAWVNGGVLCMRPTQSLIEDCERWYWGVGPSFRWGNIRAIADEACFWMHGLHYLAPAFNLCPHRHMKPRDPNMSAYAQHYVDGAKWALSLPDWRGSTSAIAERIASSEGSSQSQWPNARMVVSGSLSRSS